MRSNAKDQRTIPTVAQNCYAMGDGTVPMEIGTRMKYGWLMLPLLMLVAGCPVTQSQDTPVSARQEKTPSGAGYWIYVPSYYSEEKTWPLVITLHGTHGWDSSTAQMKEWKIVSSSPLLPYG